MGLFGYLLGVMLILFGELVVCIGEIVCDWLVVIVCWVGGCFVQVIVIFRKVGFDVVVNFGGGMLCWCVEGCVVMDG